MSIKETQVSTIILAAGSGTRMNAGENKLFLKIRGIPILYRTLYRINQFKAIDSIILVCKASEQKTIKDMIRDYGEISKFKDFVQGGKERSDSVNRGLEKVLTAQKNGLVMTHDGARPFISELLIENLIDAVESDSIAIPALKVFETVRKKDELGITSVVDRRFLYTVQTPQVFQVNGIQSCFLDDDKRSLNLTDEASYFEVMGRKVTLVEGEKWNIKLTTPEDITWAEALLEKYQQLRLGGLDY